MRRLALLLLLLIAMFLPALPVVDAEANEFLAWVDVRSDWTPTTTGANSFTVGEGSVTDAVFAPGRALQIRRVGDTTYTTGYVVVAYASGGASHRATVTVDGPALGVNGAILIQWLSDDVMPIVRIGPGVATPSPELYSPGWYLWDADSPTLLFGVTGALGARSWTMMTATAAPHDLGGTEHNADTLADLNAKVSDATLDDSGDPRDPNAHAATHDVGGGDEMSDFSGAITINGGADTLGDVVTNSASRHTQGTDQGLDTGGPNAVTAAQLAPLPPLVDQDVTIGATPTFAVTNMTGSASGLDSVAVHTNAANEISTIGEKPTPAPADLLIIEDSDAAGVKKKIQVGNLPDVGDTIYFDFDLTGTTDFQAGGTGTNDAPSGFTVYGADVSGATTCEISSNLLQIDLSAAGSDKSFYLVAPLPDLTDLYLASSISVTVVWDLDVDGGGSATNFDTADDLIWFQVGNEDTQVNAITESPYLIFRNQTGTRGIGVSTRFDDAYTAGANAAVANWDHAGHVSMVSTLDSAQTMFYDEDTPVGYYSAVHHAGEWHVRPTATSGPYLAIWVRAKNGGRVAADISAITVTIMGLGLVGFGLRRRLDPYGEIDRAA